MGGLGEFALIRRINSNRVQSPAVRLGPGDDAAVVAAPDGRFAVTTDMLVQERHFRLDWSSPYQIGRKAIAQNAADVVAMGAVPTAFVVALGLPAEMPVSFVDGLADGMWDEAESVGASIAGGDLVRSPLVVVSVTAFGDLRGRPALTRSGARAGDTVAVAGRLGWSAAGYAVLSRGLVERDVFTDVLAFHRAPRPPYSAVLDLLSGGAGESGGGRSESSRAGAESVDRGIESSVAGVELAFAGMESAGAVTESSSLGIESVTPTAQFGHGSAPVPHTLTDISDGLIADLGHIAESSGVAIDLDLAALADPALERIARELNADAAQWILTGGEDHAFAGAFSPESALPEGWRAIGRVVAGRGVTVDGAPISGAGGWESFRGAAADDVAPPR
nr:thiamine-phosphate kinase [Nocardia panacis]